jgi:hypothetical protein
MSHVLSQPITKGLHSKWQYKNYHNVIFQNTNEVYLPLPGIGAAIFTINEALLKGRTEKVKNLVVRPLGTKSITWTFTI